MKKTAQTLTSRLAPTQRLKPPLAPVNLRPAQRTRLVAKAVLTEALEARAVAA